MYEIDKNVPIPQCGGMTASLRAMKVGDSFLIQPRQRQSTYPIARGLGIKITVRREGDQLRVWRIA